jgi:transposase
MVFFRVSRSHHKSGYLPFWKIIDFLSHFKDINAERDLGCQYGYSVRIKKDHFPKAQKLLTKAGFQVHQFDGDPNAYLEDH